MRVCVDVREVQGACRWVGWADCERAGTLRFAQARAAAVLTQERRRKRAAASPDQISPQQFYDVWKLCTMCTITCVQPARLHARKQPV